MHPRSQGPQKWQGPRPLMGLVKFAQRAHLPVAATLAVPNDLANGALYADVAAHPEFKEVRVRIFDESFLVLDVTNVGDINSVFQNAPILNQQSLPRIFERRALRRRVSVSRGETLFFWYGNVASASCPVPPSH